MTADEIKILEKIFDIKLDPLGKQLDRVEKRVEKVEEKLNDVDERLGNVENRLGSVENRLGSVENKLENVETELHEFRSTTEGTLLIITEELNKLATKDDVIVLENRMTTLESQHKN